MAEVTTRLVVDIIEVLVAAAIVIGYGYVALIEGQRIDDRLIEGLVVTAAIVMFGDQYQEHLGGALAATGSHPEK